MTTPAAKTWLEISRTALAHNVRALRRVIGEKVRLMAVVKSNAYGHGVDIAVPEFDIAGAERFGVDSIDEAFIVRLLTKKPILILGWVPRGALADAVAAGFSLTVYDPRTISRLAAFGTKQRPAKIHLKIETGTSRQGVLPEHLASCLSAFRRANGHIVLEGISTHFSDVEDDSGGPYARLQLERFHKTISKMESGLQSGQPTSPLDPSTPRPLQHAAASAAALVLPETRLDMVRSGIALYGLWPSAAIRAIMKKKGPRLRPALEWKTRVAQVKRLPKGTPVGYGRTETLKRDSAVAILAAGYVDGYDRRLSSRGTVLIHGRTAKILGQVCMNMCMADVTGIPGVRAGNEAALIGRQGREQVTADDLARLCGTTNYEIVSRVNPLLPRRPMVAGL